MGGQVVKMINQQFSRPAGYRREVLWLRPLQVMEIAGPKGKLRMLLVTKFAGSHIYIKAKFITSAGCILFTRDWAPNSFLDLSGESGVVLLIRGIIFNQQANDIHQVLVEATTTH